MFKQEVFVALPWCPSVNHYYILVRNRKVLGKKGREYRVAVKEIIEGLKAEKMTGRVTITIVACPPDRRKRDIDNILKCLLDALEKGGMFEDDNQIDNIALSRGEVVKGGAILCMIQEHPHED